MRRKRREPTRTEDGGRAGGLGDIDVSTLILVPVPVVPVILHKQPGKKGKTTQKKNRSLSHNQVFASWRTTASLLGGCPDPIS